MSGFKPVAISTAGFAFCRYTAAALVWAALLSGQKWILLVVCVIMALSWLLKIQRAPLIMLYKVTIDRLVKPQMVMVDEGGMRFAHGVGGIMSAIAFLVWTFLPSPWGQIITLLLAVLKTSSALGRCSALKLYNCMQGGNCCRFGKRIREKRNV